MKLLRRDEVLTIKASERKTEIDAGLKLARRVDELREVKNKEEGDLQKFKSETVKIVQGEIDDLFLKKENLEYEIGVLERQNLNLKQPFDEEWELVKMKRLSDLDAKLIDLEDREKKVAKDEHEFSFRDNELKLMEARVADENRLSERNLKEATLSKEEAHEILINAKLQVASIQSEIDAKSNAFKLKENDWIAKERDLSMREEALRRSVRELARREKFINDKYLTLSRTLKSKGLSV